MLSHARAASSGLRSSPGRLVRPPARPCARLPAEARVTKAGRMCAYGDLFAAHMATYLPIGARHTASDRPAERA